MAGRMRLTEHVAYMGRKVVHIGFLWDDQKERDNWEDMDMGGTTALKWILEK
jgi:hypothetical protein